MSKTPEDLRDRLFAAIDGVRNGTVTVETAGAINQLAQTIVNLSKVEVDYARVTEGKSRFLHADADAAPTALPNGITGVRRHLLKDD